MALAQRDSDGLDLMPVSHLGLTATVPCGDDIARPHKGVDITQRPRFRAGLRLSIALWPEGPAIPERLVPRARDWLYLGRKVEWGQKIKESVFRRAAGRRRRLRGGRTCKDGCPEKDC